MLVLVWKLFQSLRIRSYTQFPPLAQPLLKKQAQTKLGMTIFEKLEKFPKRPLCVKKKHDAFIVFFREMYFSELVALLVCFLMLKATNSTSK